MSAATASTGAWNVLIIYEWCAETEWSPKKKQTRLMSGAESNNRVKAANSYTAEFIRQT